MYYAALLTKLPLAYRSFFGFLFVPEIAGIGILGFVLLTFDLIVLPGVLLHALLILLYGFGLKAP